MEQLLSYQTPTTISEWCKERGTDDILNYYAYLDVLHIYCNNEELSNLVFSNDEIVACIFTKLYGYSLLECQLVCKSWYEVAKTMEAPILSYWEDAALNTDWYHLSRLKSFPDKHKCCRIFVRRGYELIVKGRYKLPDSSLCICAAEGSDGSDRYFNLFISRRVLGDYSRDDRFVILRACIVGNDLRMFKYAYHNMLGNGLHSVQLSSSAAYHGRINILEFMMSMIPDLLDTKGNCVNLVTASYCGVDRERILDYVRPLCKYAVTNTNILERIVKYGGILYTLTSIRDIIELVRSVSKIPEGISVMQRGCEASHSIEELEELWELVKGAVLDKDKIRQIIVSLVIARKYDEVKFLTSRDRVRELTTKREIVRDYGSSMIWFIDNIKAW